MACNCVNCNCSIQLCKYKCETSGYNIYNEKNEFNCGSAIIKVIKPSWIK